MSRTPTRGLSLALLSAVLLSPLAAQTKRVLAWGDTLTAYQHDSISHALAVMERLGHESGAYEMYIRTDSQLITKHPVPAPARNTRNLREDKDFPVSWAKMYGKGRVFYSTFGHAAETWDDPQVRTMYFEAARWALRLTGQDVTPGNTAPRK